MTQIQDERLGKLAYNLHEKIVQREELRRKLLAENMADLCVMYEEKLYKAYLGDDEAPWAAYLAEMRVFYTRNQVDTFLRVNRRLTKELGVDPSIWVEAPLTRITDILPFVDKDNYEMWLIDANLLTTRDWNIRVREAKGFVTEEQHEDHDFDHYKTCKICGKKVKEHDTKRS